jgi:hypothetical protein
MLMEVAAFINSKSPCFDEIIIPPKEEGMSVQLDGFQGDCRRVTTDNFITRC